MGQGGVLLIWIFVFFAIFYFLAIRPQRRQKQAHQEMVTMMKKGDEVVTIGGVFGTVRRIGDDWVELEIAKGTRAKFLKRAVSSIVSEEDEEDEYVGDELEAGDEEELLEEYADEELVEEDLADEGTPPDEEEPEPGSTRAGS
jgi:preprotein translocase subunit YajC